LGNYIFGKIDFKITFAIQYGLRRSTGNRRHSDVRVRREVYKFEVVGIAVRGWLATEGSTG